MKHIIEDEMMDKDPEDTISKHLAGRPIKISAGPVCVSNRDRLFWLVFSIEPVQGETLTLGTRRNELRLIEDTWNVTSGTKGGVRHQLSKDTSQPCNAGKSGPDDHQTPEASVLEVWRQ